MATSHELPISVASALTKTRYAFVGVAALSAVSNVLMLVSPLFMMQVYDRVLPGKSMPTLLALSTLALGIFLVLAIIELVRTKILLQIGRVLDEMLNLQALRTVLALSSAGAKGNASSLPLRDLDQIRQFMGGPATIAIADLPWVPIFVIVLFLFHPLFGLAVSGGVLVLLTLTFASEYVLRKPSRRSAQLLGERWELVDAGRRSVETLRAMGMVGQFQTRFEATHQKYMVDNLHTSDLTATFSAVTKIFRLAFQSAMLALGTALVLDQMASPGAIIAASILSSKALAPIESATAQWKTFIAARQSMRRLQETFIRYPENPGSRTVLPLPVNTLAVEAMSVVAPGDNRPILQNISFGLKAGQSLGVIGPSGSGKSSLGRALVGVWPAAKGCIRLDGAEFRSWDTDAIGSAIGYLSQEVELFAGTVAENISRFVQSPPPELIIDAAKSAGVHELILSMPLGYDTQIGIDGTKLSGGQRQRIALARALYGRPFLIVLDEPNSNLDVEGEMALADAISSASRQGSIVVVIAHRANILQVVDHVLIVKDGTMGAFGAREDILRALSVEPRQVRKVA